MAVIEVDGLRKSYGDNHALRGVSFEVAEGEVFALLGPNGAGKTTATEILEGYRSRSAGTVSVLGFDPASGGSAMRERIGIVLQSCGIVEQLTVAETIEMYGSYYAHPRPAAELIELVELEEKPTAQIRTLSGGQRRRLDLALGLVGDPDLLFLDEPTTGFDPSARRSAWRTIRNLCTLGKTVFLTTHFMDEAQELANRLAVIADGEIVASGTPADLGGRDTAPATISFVLPAGTPPGELPAVPGATIGFADDRVTIVTATPVAAAYQLTGWAIGRGIELEQFAVTPPSLEDVYLRLTGHADEGVAR
ncbi:MAG: type transport system ATP-binding protein [Frankiaceae bacterium]|jgi:ABC-2 type transport system ATP-binding protein|nr:type transport system ATP-binding protein [Frankiaceae bacterium]